MYVFFLIYYVVWKCLHLSSTLAANEHTFISSTKVLQLRANSYAMFYFEIEKKWKKNKHQKPEHYKMYNYK